MVTYVLLPFDTQEEETPIPKGGDVGEVQVNLEMLPPIVGINQPGPERMTPLLSGVPLPLKSLTFQGSEGKQNKQTNTNVKQKQKETPRNFSFCFQRESAGLAFLLLKQGNHLPLYPPNLS